MGTRPRQLVPLALLTLLAACTSSASQADDNRDGGSNEESGPILFVSRDRAEVGDSDDIHGAFLAIERVSPGEAACLRLHRTTPEGMRWAKISQ